NSTPSSTAATPGREAFPTCQPGSLARLRAISTPVPSSGTSLRLIPCVEALPVTFPQIWLEIMLDRGGDNGLLRTNRRRRRSVPAPQCLITPVRKADAGVHLAPCPDLSPFVD